MINISLDSITWIIDKVCTFATEEKKELKEILSKIASFIFIPYRHDSPEDATENINRSPIALLKAQNQVVAFDESFRKKEFDILSQFSEKSLQDGNIRLFVGPGGAGKTRLMIEWTLRLQDKGWVTLFLLSGMGESTEFACREIGKIKRPLFIVIDYAECRPDLVSILRNLLATTEGRKNPLRIALVARHADIWWEELKKKADISSHLDYAIVSLSPIESKDRTTIYENALQIFSDQLNTTVAPTTKQRNEATLQDPIFQRTLYLLMAAYATAEGIEITAESLLKEIVALEKRFWRVHVQKKFESDYVEDDFMESASRIVSAITLRGRVSMNEMPSLMEAVGGPSVPFFSKFLAKLYPSPSMPGMEIVGMEPDLLGEYLVWETLDALRSSGDPFTDTEFLRKTFDSTENPDEIRQAFTVLGRIAERPEAQTPEKHNIILEWLLAPLDEEHLNVRFLSAVDAALALGEKTAFCPIPDVLADVLEKNGIFFHALLICGRLPGNTVAFRRLQLWVAETIINCFEYEKRFAEESPLLYANILVFYGTALSELGRREEALEATQKAVEIWRQLAPSHFPDLAMSLLHLGRDLSELGRREEALEATREAVKIYCQLAASDPSTYLPELAGSLNNLGNMFSELGRREDALGATKKAVEIWRRLTTFHPDVSLSSLAMGLNNLGNILSELGRREEALEATREAVEMYRSLAAACPDAFLPALGMSLNNLARALDNLGRREEALDAIQEAVVTRRQLVNSCSDAFLPDLGINLNNLGTKLSDLGRNEEALKAIQEAVEIYQLLATSHPDMFLPDLGMSFNNLGIMFSELKRPEEALEATRKAVEIRRQLVASYPDATLPFLAESLNNLGRDLSNLGRCEEALKAVQEAMEIRRELVKTYPEASLPDLARCLHDLGNRFRDLGRYEEALEAYREAISINRPLAQKYPQIFEKRLLWSLIGKFHIFHAMRKPEEMPPEEIAELKKLAPKFFEIEVSGEE